MKSNARKTTEKAIKALCLAAMMAAMSFVLGTLAKTVFGPGPLRLTFENLPIIFGSITLGPVWGVCIAVVADLASCIYAGLSPTPLIAVGSAAIGLLAGVFGNIVFKNKKFVNILITEIIAQTVGSIVIKTIALYTFGYAVPLLLLRIPIYIAVSGLEAYLIWVLYKNRQIGKFCREYEIKIGKKQKENDGKEGENNDL